jgi:hypothetical protein
MRHNHALKTQIGSQVQGCLKLVLELFCSAPRMSVLFLTCLHLPDTNFSNTSSIYYAYNNCFTHACYRRGFER